MATSRTLWGKNGAAIQPDPLHNFSGGFEDEKLLIVGQRDECVGGALNLLDQVGVQHD